MHSIGAAAPIDNQCRYLYLYLYQCRYLYLYLYQCRYLYLYRYQTHANSSSARPWLSRAN